MQQMQKAILADLDQPRIMANYAQFGAKLLEQHGLSANLRADDGLSLRGAEPGILRPLITQLPPIRGYAKSG